MVLNGLPLFFLWCSIDRFWFSIDFPLVVHGSSFGSNEFPLVFLRLYMEPLLVFNRFALVSL